MGENRGIQLVYMNDKEEYPQKSSFLTKQNGSEKKTTFATLPNTTTWQQQSSNNLQQTDGISDDVTTPSNGMNIQLNDIRLKLEEKRRHIESEKRRMELAMNKQRQKVGKAAFLQAVAKVCLPPLCQKTFLCVVYIYTLIKYRMHFVGGFERVCTLFYVLICKFVIYECFILAN